MHGLHVFCGSDRIGCYDCSLLLLVQDHLAFSRDYFTAPVVCGMDRAGPWLSPILPQLSSVPLLKEMEPLSAQTYSARGFRCRKAAGRAHPKLPNLTQTARIHHRTCFRARSDKSPLQRGLCISPQHCRSCHTSRLGRSISTGAQGVNPTSSLSASMVVLMESSSRNGMTACVPC